MTNEDLGIAIVKLINENPTNPNVLVSLVDGKLNINPVELGD